ncbi:HAD family hydrolase [Candidatus Leptofilum sp.]|uniref:HAD family hydrolase n=1 Tax=Candidatus Leptofilum sp. TaxID=3241576 RepID=UPI003B5B642B
MSSSQNARQVGAVTAVLFDWDFTLAYSLGLHVSHVARTTTLFQKYGVVCTEADVMAARASLAADIASGKLTGSLRPQKKREIIRLYRELLRRLNHSDDSYDFAYDVYAGYGLLPHFLFDDVLPTLHALKERNLKLGILSNHSSSVRATIHELLGEIIPQNQITISEEVGIHKPRKTIFQRAASKLRQKPANCLYVGDNLEVDAKAAVQPGGYAGGIWIDRYEQQRLNPLPQNVHRVTNLTQLILLL